MNTRLVIEKIQAKPRLNQFRYWESGEVCVIGALLEGAGEDPSRIEIQGDSVENLDEIWLTPLAVTYKMSLEDAQKLQEANDSYERLGYTNPKDSVLAYLEARK